MLSFLDEHMKGACGQGSASADHYNPGAPCPASSLIHAASPHAAPLHATALHAPPLHRLAPLHPKPTSFVINFEDMEQGQEHKDNATAVQKVSPQFKWDKEYWHLAALEPSSWSTYYALRPRFSDLAKMYWQHAEWAKRETRKMRSLVLHEERKAQAAMVKMMKLINSNLEVHKNDFVERGYADPADPYQLQSVARKMPGGGSGSFGGVGGGDGGLSVLMQGLGGVGASGSGGTAMQQNLMRLAKSVVPIRASDLNDPEIVNLLATSANPERQALAQKLSHYPYNYAFVQALGRLNEHLRAYRERVSSDTDLNNTASDGRLLPNKPGKAVWRTPFPTENEVGPPEEGADAVATSAAGSVAASMTGGLIDFANDDTIINKTPLWYAEEANKNFLCETIATGKVVQRKGIKKGNTPETYTEETAREACNNITSLGGNEGIMSGFGDDDGGVDTTSPCRWQQMANEGKGKCFPRLCRDMLTQDGCESLDRNCRWYTARDDPYEDNPTKAEAAKGEMLGHGPEVIRDWLVRKVNGQEVSSGSSSSYDGRSAAGNGAKPKGFSTVDKVKEIGRWLTSVYGRTGEGSADVLAEMEEADRKHGLLLPYTAWTTVYTEIPMLLPKGADETDFSVKLIKAFDSVHRGLKDHFGSDNLNDVERFVLGLRKGFARATELPDADVDLYMLSSTLDDDVGLPPMIMKTGQSEGGGAEGEEAQPIWKVMVAFRGKIGHRHLDGPRSLEDQDMRTPWTVGARALNEASKFS